MPLIPPLPRQSSAAAGSRLKLSPLHAASGAQVPAPLLFPHDMQSASGLPARLGPPFLSCVHLWTSRSMGLSPSNRPGWFFCSGRLRAEVRSHHTPEQIHRTDGSHGEAVCGLCKQTTHRGGPGSKLELPHHLAGRLVASPCWRFHQERRPRVKRRTNRDATLCRTTSLPPKPCPRP